MELEDVSFVRPFAADASVARRTRNIGASLDSIWHEPPRMDVGAPQPCIRIEGDILWLSYRTVRADHFAVIRFSGVKAYQLGECGTGLEVSAFHEVGDPELLRDGLRRWLITFRDETLELTARDAEIVVRAIQACDAGSALAMVQV